MSITKPANGYIYLVSEAGLLTVVRAGDEFEKVHQLDLGERVHATPAIAGNTLFVRTEKTLRAYREGEWLNPLDLELRPSVFR